MGIKVKSMLVSAVILLFMLSSGVTMAGKKSGLFGKEGANIIQTAQQATLTLTSDKKGKLVLSGISSMSVQPQSYFNAKAISMDQYLGYWKPGKGSLKDWKIEAMLIGTYTTNGTSFIVGIPVGKVGMPTQDGGSLVYDKVEVLMRSLPTNLVLNNVTFLMSPVPTKVMVEMNTPW